MPFCLPERSWFVMEIKKHSKVKVPYRLDLGIGSVLQVAETVGEGEKSFCAKKESTTPSL
jgi:hypothetical protein